MSIKGGIFFMRNNSSFRDSFVSTYYDTVFRYFEKYVENNPIHLACRSHKIKCANLLQ